MCNYPSLPSLNEIAFCHIKGTDAERGEVYIWMYEHQFVIWNIKDIDRYKKNHKKNEI
jgi:hypothetical protein